MSLEIKRQAILDKIKIATLDDSPKSVLEKLDAEYSDILSQIRATETEDQKAKREAAFDAAIAAATAAAITSSK